MRDTSVLLYVSEYTWWAIGARTGAPLRGTHERDAFQPGHAGEQMRARFGDRMRVRLMLSSRLCRFLVLPWRSDAERTASMRAYVEDAFVRTWGVDASSHHLQIDWPRYGEPIVCAAYPRALVERIAAAAGDGARLERVGTSVDAIVRMQPVASDAGAVLLAYAEDDGITAITLEDGHIAQIESVGDAGGDFERVEVWCARKRFQFADAAHMRWLATAPMPAAYPGTSIALPMLAAAASPGHALAVACR